MNAAFGKLLYLLECAVAYSDGRRRRCPNCGGAAEHFIERKYLVTRLAECGDCFLRYRVPTDKPRTNAAFYQDSYTQGFTTDCPAPAELERLLNTGFVGHEKDFSGFLEIFRLISPQPSLTICDFGCSWGYGAWQFEQSGHKVVGYEISKPRARYASENLGIQVTTDLRESDQRFDIFFSNHVLEHVPVVADIWKLAKSTLKVGGLFIAATPNGSDDHRQADPKGYSRRWGKVHPAVLSDRFLQKLFAKQPFFLTSTPYAPEQLRTWDKRSQRIDQMKGSELLAIAINDG